MFLVIPLGLSTLFMGYGFAGVWGSIGVVCCILALVVEVVEEGLFGD